ncbi:hypothetical protein EMIT0324P_30034 [Pseudomonas chlororaphis]
MRLVESGLAHPCHRFGDDPGSLAPHTGALKRAEVSRKYLTKESESAPVAAAERSEAAIDCAAGAKPANVVCQAKHRRLVCGRFAPDRSLAELGSGYRFRHERRL